MKKNLTFISTLFMLLAVFSLSSINNLNAQCYDYNPGAFADGLGGPFTDLNTANSAGPIVCGATCGTATPTGFEVYVGEGYTIDNLVAGSQYVIDLSANCNPNTIITVGAANADGTTADPLSPEVFTTGCSLTWTVPADGNYIIVIQTAANCGSNPIATDNGTIQMDCGPNGATCSGAAPTCQVATLTTTDINNGTASVGLCPGETYPITTDGSEVGTTGLVFFPQAGAAGGPFAGGAWITQTAYPVDLAGNIGDPAMTGEWAVYLSSSENDTDIVGTLCGLSADSLVVNFLDFSDPSCAAGPCVAPAITSASTATVCPGEEYCIETDGTQEADGGFWIGFDNTVSGGTGALEGPFPFTGFEAGDFPLCLDNDLNGALSNGGYPPLAGTWDVKIYSIDALGAPCDSSSIMTLTFTEGPTGTATATYDCANNSIVVDLTASSTSSGNLEAGGMTTAITGPGMYTISGLTPDQTYTVSLSDGICPDAVPLVGVLPECSIPCDGSTEVLMNGDFENAVDTVWVESNIQGFGVVDGVLPLSGALSAFFGGWGGPTTTTIQQDITIPVNSYNATLSFWAIGFGDCTAGNDLTVMVDGMAVSAVTGDNGNCGDGEFHLYTVDMTAYADGAAHSLVLSYNELAPVSGTNAIFVDDISLEACVCPDITVTGSSTDETCGNGTGTATASATGAVSYDWDNQMTGETIMGLSAGDYVVTATDANGCTGTTTVTVGNTINTLTVTVSATDQTCGNSQGTATASSPDAVSYMWNNGMSGGSITGLGSGVYEVTATDAIGCTGTASVTVGDTNSTLLVTATGTDEICGNGTGTATASATGAVSYEWNNAMSGTVLTGLSEGMYTVTATDANGCTATGSVTVANIINTLTITPTSSPASCGMTDGTASVSVSGGTGTYTYAWNTTANTASLSNLPAGTYVVTATDGNGCTASMSITVGSNGGPNVISDVANTNNVSCNGGSDGAISITVGGGTSPYNFLWPNIGQTSQNVTGLSAGTYTCIVTNMDGSCPFVYSYTVTEPDAIAITMDASTNVTCNGAADGTISISVTGGTGAYSYAWDNGMMTGDISGLAPGDYSVVVTDENNCTMAAGPYSITEPSALAVATDSSTDAMCNGGSDGTISITASGGTAPYTYAWDNMSTDEDLTGLAAGDYSGVVTDANGCTMSTGTITIGEPTMITIMMDASTNVTCNGAADGTISISVAGGTGAYSFAWDSGSTDEDPTGLASGDHSVVVTDANGCTMSAGPYTITEPDALAVATSGTTSTSCNGGSDGAINITASGGTAPYTYAWDNGSTDEDPTGLVAGDYSAVITDANGCTISTGLITVSEPDALSSTTDLVEGSLDNDGSISITAAGGTFPYTYLWSNGETTDDITGLAAGDYTCTITDANGCTYTTGIITVDDRTGVADLDQVASYTLAPNPTSGNVRIQMELNAAYDVSITVYDVTGKTIHTDARVAANQATFDVNLSEAANGLYFARIIVDGQTFTERIIKSN